MKEFADIIFKNQPVFAGVEPRKKLENAPVFVEQAEMEAI